MRRSRKLKDALEQAFVFYLLGRLAIAMLLRGSPLNLLMGAALDKVPEHGVTEVDPEIRTGSEVRVPLLN